MLNNGMLFNFIFIFFFDIRHKVNQYAGSIFQELNQNFWRRRRRKCFTYQGIDQKCSKSLMKLFCILLKGDRAREGKKNISRFTTHAQGCLYFFTYSIYSQLLAKLDLFEFYRKESRLKNKDQSLQFKQLNSFKRCFKSMINKKFFFYNSKNFKFQQVFQKNSKCLMVYVKISKILLKKLGIKSLKHFNINLRYQINL